MDSSLADERDQLVRSVAGFLEKWSPQTEVRRLMDAGGAADPAVWSEMADLGLQGLIIPECYGGGGFGHLELALVLEQMGGALLVAPFLSSVLAASALMESDDEMLKAAHRSRPASRSVRWPWPKIRGGGTSTRCRPAWNTSELNTG
jgi:alkylation response protein AidB-like acyl-CoA dehydrogenase